MGVEIEMIKIPKKEYELSRTTVTQKQWCDVMDTKPWKGKLYVMEGDDYPAVYVSWNDTVAFCERLSQMEGRTYRLPTEVEWEYACRAGATTAYYFGDNATELDKYAWFDKNTWDINENYPHRVAQKLPNKFGLYDMHGNVWEWCDDLFDKEYRVLRGGSWYFSSVSCSAWCRLYLTPENRSNGFGFRLARTLYPYDNRCQYLSLISGLDVKARSEKNQNVFDFYLRKSGKIQIKTIFTYRKAKVFAQGVAVGRMCEK